MNSDDVLDALALLDDWEARYEFIGDLGRELIPPTPDEQHDGNLVPGCNTRTWLTAGLTDDEPPRVEYRADAETPLVKGLVALLLVPFQHQTPETIMATDPRVFIDRTGLEQALSPNRRAGMEHFIQRVYELAQGARAAA